MSLVYALSSKMFSAPAVAHMLSKKNTPAPVPKTKPVNMGPASSATEAFNNLYVKKQPAAPKKPKKVYNCQHCLYSSEYQHNRNRHEVLVHGAARPPTSVKNAPEPERMEEVVEGPKEKEVEPTVEGHTEEQEPEVEGLEGQDAEEKEVAGSKKRKIPVINEVLTAPQKKAKKVEAGVKPTEEEEGKKDKETMTEHNNVEGGGIKWVKIDTGNVVVYTHYAVVHICA